MWTTYLKEGEFQQRYKNLFFKKKKMLPERRQVKIRQKKMLEELIATNFSKMY